MNEQNRLAKVSQLLTGYRAPEIWQEAFLAVLEKSGNVSDACRAAGITRTAAYYCRKHNEKFADAWEESMIIARDGLEAEAYRRAVDGVDEPVYQRGELVGMVRKYSDVLLITLLKANLREKYAERSINLNIDLATLSDDELDKLAKGKV